MNRNIFFLLCLFVFSRLLFINSFPVFFDSPEYLSRFSNQNFIQAIVSGHIPFHSGYILLLWPIFQISHLLAFDPPTSIIFGQIIFSAIAVYCFYRFVKMIVNKKVALIAAVICSLTPIYWIMNESIMTESTYINYFLISVFFISSYLHNKSPSKLTFTIGFFLLGLAILTNQLVIFWTPLILSIAYYLKKEKILLIAVSIIIVVTLVCLVDSSLIAYSQHLSLQSGIYQYLFGVDIKIANNSSLLILILRFFRNLFIPIFSNNTAIILILSIVSLIKLFKKHKKLLVVLFFWILPTIYSNQWFDPLLFGRHGTISGFGFALLAAMLLEKRKILSYFVITYLLVVSIPALSLLKQPIPYLETSKFVEALPKGLLIESHFARPQIERHFSGETIYVNQPGWSKEKLKQTIDNYLNQNKPIFITSQALSEPYGTYSGPYLYPLSLSYAGKYELRDVIPMYRTEKYASIDVDAGLAIYKVVSKAKSEYPNIPILKNNRHQINYFDPIYQLWLFMNKASTTQSHNIIKE